MRKAAARLASSKSVKCSTIFISRRRYHDSALEWAQKNPDVAQACLDLPADLPPLSESSLSSPALLFSDLKGYWNWRKWKFPCSPDDIRYAQAVASHVLSAPLTLASQLLVDKRSKRSQRWCCIGARAEASLPLEYWEELLVVGEYYKQSSLQLQ